MTQDDRRTGLMMTMRRISLCVGVVIALFIALFSGGVFVTSLSARSHALQAVREAVATGVIDRVVVLPFKPGTPLHVYAPHDCLILSMLILPPLPQDPGMAAAVTPLQPLPEDQLTIRFPDYPPFHQCQDLGRVVAALDAGDPMPTTAYYHRYLHGDRILAGLVLAMMPFGMASGGLLLICWLLLGLLAAVAVRDWRRGADRPRAMAFVAVSVCLALFYGLPVYGWSFSFAPSDIVIFAFLLASYRFPLCRLRPDRFVLLMSLFGALTAAFEFLTGAIPSGLSALLVAIALGGAPDRKCLQTRLFGGVFWFSATVVFCFAVKMAVVAALWSGTELSAFVEQLSARMGTRATLSANEITQLSALGISADHVQTSRTLASAYALAKIVYFGWILAFGSHAAGAAVVLGGPLLAVARGSRALFRRTSAIGGRDRLREWTFLAVVGVAPAWYVAFPNHTIEHAFFMVRPMVWPLAVFFAGLASRYRQKSESASLSMT